MVTCALPTAPLRGFNAPCAGKGSGEGTFPVSITRAGAIAAICFYASNVNHGFLRAPDGTVISSSEIKTSVPTGATTGYVRVRMPKKTLKSNVVFRVTK
jgi:hypothetical protein